MVEIYCNGKRKEILYESQKQQKLPFYVQDFYLGKNLALTTKYQYLTEIRRFFTWLRKEGNSDAAENKDVELSTLEHLQREDVMLYIDYLKNIINAQNKYNSPTSINRSLNALRSLFTYLTVISDKNDGEPYFYRNVMAKIESLPASKTLNYRANEILENTCIVVKQNMIFWTFYLVATKVPLITILLVTSEKTKKEILPLLQ